MSATDAKPNVLIFGGVNTCSRSLAAYLLPEEGEALVSNLRIVDKFSVAPPTTYLGSQFPKILAKPNVEYKQANLTVPAAVQKVFEPPEGQAAYSYVFDLTGEIRHDRPAEVQIQQTAHISHLLGLEAARRNVKAYVRLQQPFYETPEKGEHDEKESLKPLGQQGVWWHETIRMLASIPDLNLVVLRIGLVYGPYVEWGGIATMLTVAAVYGHMKKPMKGLWSPGKNSMNTIHVVDVAGGMWACAEWMAPLGRKEANMLAGEDIFSNDKSKIKGVDDVPNPSAKLVAPLFNLVDDSNSTLLSIGNQVTTLFGTSFGFYDFITNALAKFSLSESMVEDINDEHVGAWTNMITECDPPITNSPLTAYMDEYSLQKKTVAFNNAKIKNVVGYTLKRPQFDQDNLKEVVEKWKEERSWPA